MGNETMLVAVVAGFIIMLIIVAVIFNYSFRSNVTNYEDCLRAGYAVINSNPPRCRTPDGKLFVAPTLNRKYLPYGDYYFTINYQEMNRSFWLHIPKSYKGQSMPLVIMLHGGMSDGSSFANMTRMNELADNSDFIVAYPEGTGVMKGIFLSWNSGRCCGYAQQNEIDDVGFLISLINTMVENYSVNKDKVFIAGFSNGGMLAYRAGCEISDMISGIAVVSGALVVDNCEPKKPISVIAFHGTNDENLPYGGGVGNKSIDKVYVPSTENIMQFWAAENNCSINQKISMSAEHVEKREYLNCSGNVEVVLYKIEGGGHAWPGGEKSLIMGDEPTEEIDASETIAKFFMNKSG